MCQGQILSISQNSALFSLLGTNYGGDSRSNFGLPNLQGRVALHAGASPGPGLSPYSVGETTGAPTETLLLSQMAQHLHSTMAEPTPANLKTPSATTVLGRSSGGDIYHAPDNSVGSMAADIIGSAGAAGPNPHNNMMPFLVLNYCIALQGIFPPRP